MRLIYLYLFLLCLSIFLIFPLDAFAIKDQFAGETYIHEAPPNEQEPPVKDPPDKDPPPDDEECTEAAIFAVGSPRYDPTSPFTSPFGKVYTYKSVQGLSSLIWSEQNNISDYGYFGSFIQGVNDINGDLLPDLVVGTGTFSSGNGLITIYGYTGEDLAGSSNKIFEVQGPDDPDTIDSFGTVIAGIRSVDGDASDDIIVSQTHWQRDGDSFGYSNGKIYVYSGSSENLIWEKAQPSYDSGNMNENYIRWAYFGSSVDSIPDINDDGVEDVVVAGAVMYFYLSTEAHVPQGKIWIFSGVDGELLGEMDMLGQPHTGFGYSVTGVSDLNNDGRGDIIVSQPRFSPADNRGKVMALSGANGILLWEKEGNPGEKLGGPKEELNTIPDPDVYYYNKVNKTTNVIGDVDGDMINDILVGAPNANNLTGKVYILSGATGAEIGVSQLNGENNYDEFGHFVSAVRDMDGDCIDDVLVGAPFYNCTIETEFMDALNCGKAYVYSSVSGNLLFRDTGEHEFANYGWSVTGLPY